MRAGATAKGDERPTFGEVRAEPEVRAQLERLSTGENSGERLEEPVGECADRSADARRRADEVFARIAWSGIAEPGDGVAGTLLAGLGAGTALEILVRASGAAELRSAVAAAGIDLDAGTARAAFGRWAPRLSRARVLQDIDQALRAGMRIVVPGDAFWPDALADLGAHQPLMLWLRGEASLLRAPALSVVGARAATEYGTDVTAEIVTGVCGAGLTIVSGAAYGVDAVAHRAALAAGAPTVAVLAGGADHVYPAAHAPLLGRISRDGLVCAEMPPGSTPTRWRFLQRNRIIAALSGATLVTEAGMRSGTLNTAGHAASLGRTLGAVPGPVTSAASVGCHRLIREYGATLVTNASEACELLGFDDRFGGVLESGIGGDAVGSGAGSAGPRESSLHRRVVDALPLRGGRAASEVARRAGLSLEEARGGLAELELLGRVGRRDSPGVGEELWALVRRQ